TKTYIVRKQGSIPTNKDDGTVVYNDNGNAFIDTGLNTNTQYCYAAYATDNTEYTEPVTGCASTISTGLIFIQSTDGNYTVDKFTLPAGATVSGGLNWTPPLGVNQVEYLVVAGGGGGGGNRGGGGGAGGFRTGFLGVVPGDVYTVAVGKGGVGGVNNDYGTNGENSVFSSIISIGGGGGGYNNSWAINGKAGGSGGGACRAGTGGAGTAGQGNNGGNGNGGSGGGAGAAGVDTGAGGAGLQSSITGVAVYYAGGGAPNNRLAPYSQLQGGIGGGGPGAYGVYNASNNPATGGVDGLGGGGGGGKDYQTAGNQIGGKGGSGVVIIRYLTPQ
ncbi:MAG: hypothetical protein PHW52_04455, partial [Candidatus Pacebacteria bacterium]|nr:hypothetical protein [Candidatus Paceibacterota bacterium]